MVGAVSYICRDLALVGDRPDTIGALPLYLLLSPFPYKPQASYL